MPDDNSHKALREYCKQLGITPATTGQSIDRLIGQARQTDNPRAWLAALGNAPPEDEPTKPSTVDPSQLVEPASIPSREEIRAALARDGEIFISPQGTLVDPLRVQVLTPDKSFAEAARHTMEQLAVFHGQTPAQLVNGNPPAEEARPESAVRSIRVALPIADGEPVGYLEREMHLDVRLDREASTAFRRLWKALDAQNARLTSGRHVGRSRADVVRYVFEQLALAMQQEGIALR